MKTSTVINLNLSVIIISLLLFPIMMNGQQIFVGQIDTITDIRDGRKYATIQIGDKIWFRDNLKYETAKTHCPNFNKKLGDCKEGNYYAYQELDTICPKGWRVPTTADWEAYIEFLQEVKNINEQVFTKVIIPDSDYYTRFIKDTTHTIQLFKPSNPLNLSALGWVQGKRRRKIGTITLWAKQIGLDDNRFHLHIGPNMYIQHTHAHNIDDKPRKVRKFIVKCVCEVNSK